MTATFVSGFVPRTIAPLSRSSFTCRRHATAHTCKLRTAMVMSGSVEEVKSVPENDVESVTTLPTAEEVAVPAVEDAEGDVGQMFLEGDAVSVIDVEDEDEEDMDYEGIEPCTPPQFVLNRQKLQEIRQRFKLHDTDSGSPEYQVASLTVRIEYITNHLKENRKDFAATRGLLRLVSKRRRLLKYVKRQDPSRFDRLVKELEIRVSQELRNV